ncbi:TLC domain-containing protein 1 [Balamuthia mandrillaris]
MVDLITSLLHRFGDNYELPVAVLSLAFWHYVYSLDYRKKRLSLVPYELSLLHAVITFLLAAIILWQTREYSWELLPNEACPLAVVTIIFSWAYMLRDLIDGFVNGTSETIFVLHHLLVIFCYSCSLLVGEYIKLTVLHLFHSELGNCVHHAKRVGLLGGGREPGLWDSLFVLLNRIVWFLHLVPGVILYMLSSSYTNPKWRTVDYLAFFGSVFLMFGCMLFIIDLVKKVVSSMSSSSSSEARRAEKPLSGGEDFTAVHRHHPHGKAAPGFKF